MIAQMLLKNKEKSTYTEDRVGEKPIFFTKDFGILLSGVNNIKEI